MIIRNPGWKTIIFVCGSVGVVTYIFRGWGGVTELFFVMAAILGIGAFVNTDRHDEVLEDLMEKLKEKNILTGSDITDIIYKLKGLK